jgi:ankyrin repeat protein
VEKESAVAICKDGWEPKRPVAPKPYEGAELAARKKELELMEAARLGSVLGVRRWLSEGADADFKDREGNGPLLVALGASFIGVDANLDSVDDDRLEVVELLLGAGADPKRPSKNFEITPLMLAAASADARLVRSLLPLSDPDAVDGVGMTALVMAVTKRRDEAVDLLLSQEALAIKTPGKRSVLEWIASFRGEACAKELADRAKALTEALELESVAARAPASAAAIRM